MAGFIMDVLLVALGLAALGYSGYSLWVYFSIRGKRVNQQIHKAVIERGVTIRCSKHGTFPLAEAIETDHGLVCPVCYKSYISIPTINHNGEE